MKRKKFEQETLADLLRKVWLKMPIQDPLKKAKWVLRDWKVQPFRKSWAHHIKEGF